MCRKALVPICLLLSVSARSGAQESAPIDFETARFERRLSAKRAAGVIVIDGQLDEADWRAAPLATDFLQNDPREGEPATARTEVRVLYDDENLYFGFIAYDAEPDKLVINDLTRDFNALAGDAVGVVLDTFHDERNGYMFETSPAGAKFDAQFINEGREFNELGRRVARKEPGHCARMGHRDCHPLQNASLQRCRPAGLGCQFLEA